MRARDGGSHSLHLQDRQQLCGVIEVFDHNKAEGRQSKGIKMLYRG